MLIYRGHPINYYIVRKFNCRQIERTDKRYTRIIVTEPQTVLYIESRMFLQYQIIWWLESVYKCMILKPFICGL